MGSKSSKGAPRPDSFSEQPWRKMNWGRKQELLNFIKGFKPSSDEVSHVRILLYGPVAAGKSSFVNTVSTAIKGSSANIAPTSKSTDGVWSFTKEFRTHKIYNETTKEPFPFVFNDIMGLEASKEGGVKTEDIRLVMKGHIREGYKFNPASPLTEKDTQYYNPCPSADDKVHLLVCVFSGNFPAINTDVIDKIKVIREIARDLGIPHITIFTHIDKICKQIETDVKNVFKIEDLKNKMEEFCAYSGFDESQVFPVRNYSSGLLDGEDDMDTLILTTLKYMLDYANDFIKASKQ